MPIDDHTTSASLYGGHLHKVNTGAITTDDLKLSEDQQNINQCTATNGGSSLLASSTPKKTCQNPSGSGRDQVSNRTAQQEKPLATGSCKRSCNSSVNIIAGLVSDNTKSAFCRLQVLANEAASQPEQNVSEYEPTALSLDMGGNHASQALSQSNNHHCANEVNSLGNVGPVTAPAPTPARRSNTSTNLRPSSVTGSTQRLNSSVCTGGGLGSATRGSGGDQSVTQFALIDDENVSALQQVTKGGGALTLASQWKSQFDDSEDTTDNEWKQEAQV